MKTAAPQFPTRVPVVVGQPSRRRHHAGTLIFIIFDFEPFPSPLSVFKPNNHENKTLQPRSTKGKKLFIPLESFEWLGSGSDVRLTTGLCTACDCVMRLLSCLDSWDCSSLVASSGSFVLKAIWMVFGWICETLCCCACSCFGRFGVVWGSMVMMGLFVTVMLWFLCTVIVCAGYCCLIDFFFFYVFCRCYL